MTCEPSVLSDPPHGTDRRILEISADTNTLYASLISELFLEQSLRTQVKKKLKMVVVVRVNASY